MKLKQEAFVREYLIDLNATQAAIRAGYSAKTAGQIGDENLKKPEIKAAIQEAIKKREKRTRITQDYVLGGLKEVAQRCMQRDPVLIGKGKDRRQMVATVIDPDTGKEVLAHVFQFDSAGANRALELLGKHLGIFENEDEPGAPAPTNVIVNVVDGRKAV